MDSSRWLLPDAQSAIDWAKHRNSEGISVILDVLGQYAKGPDDAVASIDQYYECMDCIHESKVQASVAVKLSTLGATFDRVLCRKNLETICSMAKEYGIECEIDMEGKTSLDFTIASVLNMRNAGHPMTLAVQAYLDRSSKDIEDLLENNVKIRLVKGAYIGDHDGYYAVRRRMTTLINTLIDRDVPFQLGTHDGIIIKETVKKVEGLGSDVVFCFLKGLADNKKIELRSKGLKVAEYVPYGVNGDTYVRRRLKYLHNLKKNGIEPLD
jgi:proline dehydrogenase